MSNMKELNERLIAGEMYNSNVSIRAVEEEDEKLVVKAIANKFLDADGVPVEDNHGTILTQATLATDNYMKYNSVVLAHHNGERPVGKVTSLNMKEDGLEVILEVYKDNDPQIFNQVKRGTLNGISIGMYINKSEYSEILDSVIIREADLVEISLVTNPSNPLSFIEAVDMCSLGVCSAIRSSTKTNRNVDKEAMKIMLKQVLAEEAEAKAAEDEVKAAEVEASRVLEEAKLEEERLAEEARLLEEGKETDEEKEARLAEEAKVTEEAKVAEEAKVVEEARLAEEARLLEESKETDEEKEARLAEEAKVAEQARIDALPPKTFEERLEEAAVAFANKEEGSELTPEQVNLLTFIIMNYGDIDLAVAKHLEG